MDGSCTLGREAAAAVIAGHQTVVAASVCTALDDICDTGRVSTILRDVCQGFFL